MRSFRPAAAALRQRQAVPPAAAALLFPELAGKRDGGLIQGLLRAPPWIPGSAPCLSAHVARPAGAGFPETPAQVLARRGWEDAALLARAAAARRNLVAARVGGAWWHGGDDPRPLQSDTCVLVALTEQAFGAPRLSPETSLPAAMLDRALTENPPDRVVVWAPDAAGAEALLAGARAKGASVIKHKLDPWLLLRHTERVYSAGCEIGFLALLADVPVRLFAEAFYGGWGASDDATGLPRHAFRRTVDEIFAGCCLLATRYRDPFRNVATTFEDTLATLADWRRLDEENRRIAVCVGMSFWKRRRVADFVRSSQVAPVFRRTVDDAVAAARNRHREHPGAIAGWASRLPDGLAAAAAQQGIPLIRVEDGFIRSVGLGSDFLPPASLVFDTRGMYYDPRQQSDLEHLLREAEFPDALLVRAERLVALLVARGITKYNLAASGPQFDVPADRRCILVPGQVEDDLSIRFGAGSVRSNLDLLASVRAANPDAFVVYKPHPDVLAGHRVGAVREAEARRFADVVVAQGSTASLLALADELHTMTSLAGFEALLRGCRVVVYGRPFYAGWGLTADMTPFERGRRLTLAQLAAGTLILYPRYLDPLTRLPCGPEIVIERLDRPELWRPGPLVLARRLQGTAARCLAEWRMVFSTNRQSRGPSSARRLKERPRP